MPTTVRVTFYVSDPDDPVIQAWQGAFGDLFSPFEDMPQELQDHLRYPEDLFRVQTDVYSKYQLQPADFFERDGAWSVAQAPGTDPRGDSGAPQTATTAATDDEQAPSELASESEAERFVPYYTMFANAAGEGEQRVRAHAAVRPVLAERPADRAAGVHDRLQ